MNTIFFISGNADGVLAPPMVMYPYERIPKHIVMRVPNGWGIGKSDSGWMTSESFFEYVSNIFYPWIVSMNIEFPILLYVDGHKSHITLSLSRFCTEKQIILICLPPNTTHILQPLHVGLFRSLKQSWKKCIKSYRVENGFKVLNRENFAPVLKMALEGVTNLKNIFQNSFRVCGLYPFDKANVDYTKVVQKVLNIEGISNNPEIKLEVVQHLRYIENHIKNTTLQKFYFLKGGEWDGDMKDKNLYEVWKSIFNKTGLSFENTTNTTFVDNVNNVIIEVEEGIDLERDWEALIVETPDNEFDQEILENDINIIQNTMLTGPKNDEINDEETEKYLESKEGRTEQHDVIEVIEEATDIEKTNTDNSNEEIQENKNKETREVQDESKDSKGSTENIEKETDVVNDDSSSTGIRKKKTEDEKIEVRGNYAVFQEVENEVIEESKDKQNNEIGETIDETTVEKIEVSKEVENTEEKTENAKKEALKNIDNISPDRTKENIGNNSNLMVPSPFKKALFWPEPTPTKKVLGKKKERIPSVTTSDAWKEYYSKKEEEKNKQLEEKENRKRKRAEKSNISKKRPKKTKLEQQNASENGEVLPNASENGGEVYIEKVHGKRNLKVGDFVIVNYENNYYPGSVTAIGEEKILINSMTRSGINWKWPDEKDEIWYDSIEIMEVIQPPKKINKRGCFQVEEIAKYGSFV